MVSAPPSTPNHFTRSYYLTHQHVGLNNIVNLGHCSFMTEVFVVVFNHLWFLCLEITINLIEKAGKTCLILG